MSRLRGRVAECGVDLATEQKLAMLQQQWATEMQSFQSQLLSVHTRLDEISSKSSTTSSTVLELYASVLITLWMKDVIGCDYPFNVLMLLLGLVRKLIHKSHWFSLWNLCCDLSSWNVGNAVSGPNFWGRILACIHCNELAFVTYMALPVL